MAYDVYEIHCGRVAGRGIPCAEGDREARNALADALDDCGHSSVERLQGHDEDWPVYVAGWKIGELAPFGVMFGVTDASRLAFAPTPDQVAEAEGALAALPEPLRPEMARLPFGTWIARSAR